MMCDADALVFINWHDHNIFVTSTIQDLNRNKELHDVTIACQGHYFKAHKLVLAAVSTYFRKIFQDYPCDHPIIVITDIDWKDLRCLLQFIYFGKILVRENEVCPLLVAAESLSIVGLHQLVHTLQKEKTECKRNTKDNFIVTNFDEVTKGSTIENLHTSHRVDSRCNDISSDELDPYNNVFAPHLNSPFVNGMEALKHIASLSKMNSTSPQVPEDKVKPNNNNEMHSERIFKTGTPVFNNALVSPQFNRENIPINGVTSSMTTGNIGPSNLRDDNSELENRFIKAEVNGDYVFPPNTHPHVLKSTLEEYQRNLPFHEPRPCPTCKRVYRDAATLRTHVTIMHSTGNEAFKCTCGDMFLTKYEVSLHKKNGHK